MPGKAKRPKSIPLSRSESNIAKSILLNYFNPNEGESQMRDNSEEIVKEINDIFIENGFDPKYNKTKLSDWVSNRLYRIRKSIPHKIVNNTIKKKKIEYLPPINYDLIHLLPII